MLLLIEFSLMRNRAVGEFAATAAILCTFFALRFARTECAQIKVITPTTANDYRFLRLCVVMLWCAVDVLCNFSNCLTLELQKIQSQTAGRKRERAMHHLQCRDFYFDFMSFLSPYYYSIKKAYAFYDKLSSKMMVVAISISMLPIRPEKS